MRLKQSAENVRVAVKQNTIDSKKGLLPTNGNNLLCLL